MKKASVRDLHIRTSELVRAASEGEVITIERRGEPVAELRPIPTKREKARQERERRKLMAKFYTEMKPIWEKMPKLDGDTGRWLEENR